MHRIQERIMRRFGMDQWIIHWQIKTGMFQDIYGFKNAPPTSHLFLHVIKPGNLIG
jgi:hypothetical protein